MIKFISLAVMVYLHGISGFGNLSQSSNHGFHVGKPIFNAFEGTPSIAHGSHQSAAATRMNNPYANCYGEVEWTLDSGASVHITNQPCGFADIVPTNTTFEGVGGPVRGAAGEGSVTLNFLGTGARLTLPRVFYLADVTCNLLSMSRLADMGMSGHWDGDEINIRKSDGTLVATAAIQPDGLYSVRVTYGRDPSHQIDTAPESSTKSGKESRATSEDPNIPHKPTAKIVNGTKITTYPPGFHPKHLDGAYLRIPFSKWDIGFPSWTLHERIEVEAEH